MIRLRINQHTALAVIMAWLSLLLRLGGAWADEAPSIPQTLSKPALEREHLGLSSANDFHVTTGRCEDCRTPKPALWYFSTEYIAVPADRSIQEGIDPTAPPFLVWLGSPEIIESAMLTEDGRHLRTLDGQQIGFELAPQLSTNRSYFNDATVRFFSHRPLRLRGEMHVNPDSPHFETRTIWPADWRLTPDQVIPATGERVPTFAELIESPPDQPEPSLMTRLIWQRPTGASTWNGHPVFGVVLNGAQGDDDEALGGHVGFFTGRVGPQGEWADWLVNNFYDPDWVSEKGIVPAMVPMDKYLGDLNSGQSYYRPSYLLVMILKDDRVPTAYQRSIQQAFRALYQHDLDYDHARSNCAGLSIDPLRKLGWQIPFQGPTNITKAVAAVPYVSVADRSIVKGLDAYHYFAEEQTRLLPRTMFEATGVDLLRLLDRTQTGRVLTPFEEWIREDVQTVLFVQIPQFPSSRAWGSAPVASLKEYEHRVPADRKQWKTVSVQPRPFPDQFRTVPATTTTVSPWMSLAMLLSIPLSLVIVWYQYRDRRRKNRSRS